MVYKRDHFTGSIQIKNEPFFFKAFSKKASFIRELKGYNTISKYYPVPKLIFSGKIDDCYVLIYPYEKIVEKKGGLLIDLLSEKNKSTKRFDKILNLYKKAFTQTLHIDTGKAAKVFFQDRLKTRIPIYYSKKFIKQDIDVLVNGENDSVQLEKIIKSISRFFENKSRFLCVVSQCDPNELNISTKPLIFDYLGGGCVPLFAEFATLFWYQIFQSKHLNPKYDPYFTKKIKKRLELKLNGRIKNKYQISNSRISFLSRYIDIVLNPCLKTRRGYDWYPEFKNFLALRILGVFNVSQMSKKDVMLSLGYLKLFYSIDSLEDPHDLLALLR